MKINEKEFFKALTRFKEEAAPIIFCFKYHVYSIKSTIYCIIYCSGALYIVVSCGYGRKNEVLLPGGILEWFSPSTPVLLRVLSPVPSCGRALPQQDISGPCGPVTSPCAGEGHDPFTPTSGRKPFLDLSLQHGLFARREAAAVYYQHSSFSG